MATLKSQSAEIEPFRATPEILLFLKMRFSNIFLSYMVWNYQNEIAPIFYYGISTKTNEKDLKIPSLQPSDWKNPYWMSLYIHYLPRYLFVFRTSAPLIAHFLLQMQSSIVSGVKWVTDVIYCHHSTVAVAQKVSQYFSNWYKKKQIYQKFILS